MPENPRLDIMGFPEIVPGEKNEAGHLVGRPPKEVATILKKLTQTTVVNLSGEQQSVNVDKMSSNDLAVLNSYAAELAGVPGCKIRAIYGCGSCVTTMCNPSPESTFCRYGNLVITDCDRQCWFC